MRAILILILLSSCGISKKYYQHPEHFKFQEHDIYHISSTGKETKLNEGDLRILNIDTLKN